MCSLESAKVPFYPPHGQNQNHGFSFGFTFHLLAGFHGKMVLILKKLFQILVFFCQRKGVGVFLPPLNTDNNNFIDPCFRPLLEFLPPQLLTFDYAPCCTNCPLVRLKTEKCLMNMKVRLSVESPGSKVPKHLVFCHSFVC